MLYYVQVGNQLSFFILILRRRSSTRRTRSRSCFVLLFEAFVFHQPCLNGFSATVVLTFKKILENSCRYLTKAQIIRVIFATSGRYS